MDASRAWISVKPIITRHFKLVLVKPRIQSNCNNIAKQSLNSDQQIIINTSNVSDINTVHGGYPEVLVQDKGVIKDYLHLSACLQMTVCFTE